MPNKPLIRPSGAIPSLTYPEFGTLLFRQRKVFRADYRDSIPFYRQVILENEDGNSPGRLIGGMFELFEDMRTGKHTFTHEADFASALAHNYTTVMAALTAKYTMPFRHARAA